MYDVRWVHVFEDDTPEGEVYRRDSDEIALSRRPRDGFELHRDGSARIFSGGSDDRAVPRDAQWTENADGVVVVDDGIGTRLRIVKRDAAQLTVSRD